ncbi:thiamine phosphate synthase [Chachezhania antarctica]|uniref:thiamine phosphate synthase n=1 Tax=Chachezhania antarctica TaxID=2340860 RepID=UPI000EABB2BE|nr:thiamine phosphate synthase [Chachezhania antarctica]|tara:strand:+ start:1288 stop:1908 length:621 start_codon:yes stop_codon:yes gene_type:complete
MDAPEHPQIYLITPPSFDLDAFPDLMARVLDRVEVACLRLTMATSDADQIARAADALREVAHARDIALVVSDHVALAERLGLDGVHLSDAAKSVRAARKALPEDTIVGSFCGTSRHDGMSAGEAGADYISFGPLTANGLGDGSEVDHELFQWWSEVIEIPVVAEGGVTAAVAEALAPRVDFFGIGEEIWSTEDPAAALAELAAIFR